MISCAHQILKDIAKESNQLRIDNYLNQMGRSRERVRARYQYADSEGVDVELVMQSMGYQNMDEFTDSLQQMIQNPRINTDFKGAINDLKETGQLIREMDQSLTQEMNNHGAQDGQSMIGSGSGNGQGLMGN